MNAQAKGSMQVTRAEETLMEWLRVAHIVEEQAEAMLSDQARHNKNYPALKAGIEQHLAETKRQRERVRGCIERRGGSISTTNRDTAAKIEALAQAMSGIFSDQEIGNGPLASYMFEHMEIASYSILIAAAGAVGDTDTSRICTDILREEERMAAWLKQVMIADAGARISSENRSLEKTEGRHQLKLVT